MPALTKRKIKTLIEKCIREVLKEDYDGGDYGGYGDYYGGGDYGHGGGGGGGSERGLGGVAGIFFNPLINVGKTFLWATEYLTTIAYNAIGGFATGLYAGIMPSFVTSSKKNPGGMTVSNQFNKFRAKEIKETTKLNNRYKDVFEKIKATLENDDVWGITFLLYPGPVIAAAVLANSPKIGMSLLNAATAGRASMLINKLMIPTNATKHYYYDYNNNGDLIKKFYHDTLGEALWEDLRKEDEIVSDEELSVILKTIATDPKFEEMIDSSPFSKDAKETGAKILADRAKDVLNASTIEEISKAVGKDVQPELDKAIIKNNIPQQKVPEFTEIFLAQMKKTFEEEYVKQLDSISNSNPEMADAINLATQEISSKK